MRSRYRNCAMRQMPEFKCSKPCSCSIGIAICGIRRHGDAAGHAAAAPESQSAAGTGIKARKAMQMAAAI